MRLAGPSEASAEGASGRSSARARPRRRWQWVAVGIAAVVVLLLVIAQLVLPGIAVERVRERVGRYGEVHAVHVHADPAIQLLSGERTGNPVTAGPLQMSSEELVDLERQLDGVDRATSRHRGWRSPPPPPPLANCHWIGAPLQARRRAESLRGPATSTLQVTLPAGLKVQGHSRSSDGPKWRSRAKPSASRSPATRSWSRAKARSWSNLRGFPSAAWPPSSSLRSPRVRRNPHRHPTRRRDPDQPRARPVS